MGFWARFTGMWIVVALLSSQALPCCTAFSKIPVRLRGESSVIVWDSKTSTEHFLRSASFSGEADGFGFIIPTPGSPKVEGAEMSGLYRLIRLHDLKKAKEKDRGIQGGTKSAAKVKVLERKFIGNYEVTTLSASDASGLVSWLNLNKFKTRPAMDEWVKHYVGQKWFFTAIRYDGEFASKKTPTPLLRVSFKTDKPIYPYKMPTDTWDGEHFRPMTLFFVSDQGASGSYIANNRSWEAKKKDEFLIGERSTAVVGQDAYELNHEFKLPANTITNASVVTVFQNTSAAKNYGSDLQFSPQTVFWVCNGVGAGGGQTVLGVWKGVAAGGGVIVLVLFWFRARRTRVNQPAVDAA